MAELVAGALVSSLVKVLSAKLTSEVKDLFIGRGSISYLLTDLNKTLSLVGEAVIDAENRLILDQRLKNWFDEVKDTVYDADDLLYKIDTEEIFTINRLSRKPLINLCLPSPFISLKAFNFVRTLKTEIIKIINELNALRSDSVYLGLMDIEKPAFAESIIAPSAEESYVYGSDAENIIDLLRSDDNMAGGDNKLSVIPIVGMGGIGKTALAQAVYNDERVNEMFDTKVWITVGDGELDCMKVMKLIVEKVTGKKCEFEEPYELVDEVKKALDNKKFLFVLDDVWDKDPKRWDFFNNSFKSGFNGSKIIVTTRNISVASIMNTQSIYEQQLMSIEQGWVLLAKSAQVDVNSHLQDIGTRIVEKCTGLPLALKSIGSILRGKQDEVWEEVSKSFIWDFERSDIFPALWLSYLYLPSQLKRCFAYFAAFPKDFEFVKEKVILLWMAEGLLPEIEDGNRMEKVGEMYFEFLLSWSLFQQYNSNESSFRLHNVMHDLATFISDEFCSVEDDSNFFDCKRKIRHVSYMGRAWKLEGLSKAKGLHTFFALPLSNSHGIRSSNKKQIPVPVENLLILLSTAVTCLRVLSLSEHYITKLPNSIGDLKYLKYLDLSFTEIEELPDTVCNLYNLQTLLLEGCARLTRLPKKIKNLINLRHLHTPPFLKETPLIGEMTCLQTLSDFFVDKNTNSGVKLLHRLENLHGTLRISGLENVADDKDAEEAELMNKKSLNKLVLSWGINHAADGVKSQEERQVLGQLEPHANLKELEIRSYKGTRFPDWFGSNLLNMVTVSLYKCKSCSILPPLGQLPSLKHLMISDFPSLMEIGTEFFSISSDTKPFRCLESLYLESMPELQKWLFIEGELEGGVFPRLEELELRDCPRLKVSLPDYMPSLRKLVIDECDQLLPLLPTAAFPLLDTITISECQGQEVFLQGGLPSTLKEIVICSCENLKALDSAIQHLTSLEKLEISFCDKVGVLTELPTSLRSLTIKNYPLLTSRLQRETGEWPMIAHLPNLEKLSLLHGL